MFNHLTPAKNNSVGAGYPQLWKHLYFSWQKPLKKLENLQPNGFRVQLIDLIVLGSEFKFYKSGHMTSVLV